MNYILLQVVHNSKNSYNEYCIDFVIKKTNNKISFGCDKSRKCPIDFSFYIEIVKNSIHCFIESFYTYPSYSHLGKPCFSFLLECIIDVCEKNNINSFTISAWLSNANKQDWPDSLFAYKNFADTFGLDFYITDDKKEKECKHNFIDLEKSYVNIDDFYNPRIGKENSGYLHYSGHLADTKLMVIKYKNNMYEFKKAVDNIRLQEKQNIQAQLEQNKLFYENIVKHPHLAKLEIIKEKIKLFLTGY